MVYDMAALVQIDELKDTLTELPTKGHDFCNTRRYFEFSDSFHAYNSQLKNDGPKLWIAILNKAILELRCGGLADDLLEVQQNRPDYRRRRLFDIRQDLL